jgi:RNA polymerase sigma-70 factor (sigma-E family)
VALERNELAIVRADALARANARRDRTVAALFDAHYVDFCRLAGLLLADAAQAEEVVQEAFLRTFAGWRRIREPDRAQFYLRRAVVNLCKSRLRRRSVERRGNSVLCDRQPAAAPAWEDHTAGTVAMAEALRRLPPRQRAVVVLRYYLDLSEADIASELQTSTGTVKSQLSKARAHLARLLPPDERV